MSRTKKRTLVLGALLLPAMIGGASLGYGLKLDLPDVEALDRYTPPLNTRVVAKDGSTIGSFGDQKRTLLASKDIPQAFTQALVAVEDSAFYKHGGIDIKGIARAAWHDLKTMSLEQGASTITQQLSRNLFLTPAKTPKRKVQEMMLAMEIERRYSKEEILRMYTNQVYMGHGRYGLEAASQLYFGKHAIELTLPEASLLAGLVQRPEALSPLRNVEASIRRRSHVLDRMVEEKYLTREQANEAKGAPVILSTRRDAVDLAPYFVEEIRRLLQAKYGEDGIYKSGLEIKTGLDPAMQRAANTAIETGLRALDKRQGWRGRIDRVPAGTEPSAWASASWRAGVIQGSIVDGVVLSSARGKVRIKAGALQGSLDPESISWTGRKDPASLVKTGDIVRVRVASAKTPDQAVFALEQEPAVEGALVAIDAATGEVRAFVGGFDFRRSEFDRAMQARRQAGSAFKPIVYTAALMRGMTLSDRVLDAPTVFVEPGTLTPYQPENYGLKYYGLLTLREALEKSANVATVHVLDRTGYPPVIDLARKLGLTTDLRPYPSLGLGAFEVSLLELTSAYGAFANEGVRVEPHLFLEVKDRDGVSLETTRPAASEALSPEVAAVVNALLAGVITDGTGAAAAGLGRPLAGKTGTTDDSTDAWFIGYTPDLVVGVWVGFDQKKSLGSHETGALAALPIWQSFMEKVLDGLPAKDFPQPEGLARTSIDRRTGLRADVAAGCVEIVTETYLAGTEPTASCSAAEHQRLLLPWTLQRYTLDTDGSLVVPDEDLPGLLAADPTLQVDPGGTFIAANGISIPLRLVAGHSPRVPAALEGQVDPSTWVGKDGRPAEVVLLGEATKP